MSYSQTRAMMAIAKASFRSITRSPSAVVFTLVFPLIFITVFGFIKGGNVSLDVAGFVHIGGPVNVKAFTMLHSAEWKCSNTMRINDTFSISSSADILTNLAMGNCPARWRLFVGLCGWTPGQLENEIQGNPPFKHNHSWLVATADQDLVFELDNQSQWTKAIDHSGNEFAQNVLP
jgi:ABC-2 type transport system permease protein